jgi:hypothetical protein
MRLVTGKPSISIIAGLPYMLTAGVFTLWLKQGHKNILKHLV